MYAQLQGVSICATEMEEAPKQEEPTPPLPAPAPAPAAPPLLPPPSAQRTGPGEQLVEFEVEAVMAKRLYKNESGRTGLEYLVKWKNYTMDEATWEPEVNLIGCEQLIDEFERLSQHCADLHRSSDVLPRRRGRPPKSTPKFERISVFPSTYENVDQGSKKKNSDEEEYMDEQEESDAEDFDIGWEDYRWDSSPRRRGRGRGRVRGRRGRGRYPRLSYRSRNMSDDEDYCMRSGITRRRRGRRAGRGRGRYGRSSYGYTDGEYVGYGGAGSKGYGRKEVTQVVDLVKGEDEKSWAWVVFADGKQEYVPYNTARKNLIPQLLDMYECHLKFQTDKEEKPSVAEAIEDNLNRPTVEAEIPPDVKADVPKTTEAEVPPTMTAQVPPTVVEEKMETAEGENFLHPTEPEGEYDYVEQIL
ncbi:hypothetical protein M513_04642 [Trichuris suis]|uniref:Chromo domain-containing protein n=1 Tax=Trichuris suis TaxID=68888 RepID=A0A085MB99_9BILA|nr:hypothetical protein M513_04642 [Trichuris suis]